MPVLQKLFIYIQIQTYKQHFFECLINFLTTLYGHVFFQLADTEIIFMTPNMYLCIYIISFNQLLHQDIRSLSAFFTTCLYRVILYTDRVKIYNFKPWKVRITYSFHRGVRMSSFTCINIYIPIFDNKKSLKNVGCPRIMITLEQHHISKGMLCLFADHLK